MKRFLGIIGVLGVLVLGGANFAFCGSVTVTGTDTVFMTIQAGVDACSMGGTVSVAAGTYTEAVYVNKGIALVGAGSNSTTITVPGRFDSTNIVTFSGTATNNASIAEFRIIRVTTGSYAMGEGIYCGTASPTLSPFAVKVTDTYGNPIAGHTVNWQITDSPATANLSATTTTTGIDGTAVSTLTLGTKSGTYKITATSGSMQATFTATGTPITIPHITIENFEAVEIGTYSMAIDESLTLYLRSYDADNNLIGDVAGTWTVSGDIGNLTSSYGICTVFNPSNVGTGTIIATNGVGTDTIWLRISPGSPIVSSITPNTGTNTGTLSTTINGDRFLMQGMDTAWDFSGYGNYGTITGATCVDGKYGKGLSFDGSNDYVDCEDNNLSISSIVNNFSVEFWACPLSTHQIDTEKTSGADGMQGQKYAIGPNWGDKWGTEHAGAGISIGTNGISVYEHAWNYMPALLVYQGNISGWNHIVVTYTNKQPKLYLNGNLARTGLTSPKSYIHILPDKIGGMSYGYFNGMIDEVRIYNQALSPEDIKKRYQGYSGIKEDAVVLDMPFGIMAARARLTKDGQADIIGTNTQVIDSGKITAIFNLTEAEPGTWNVVVTNPDGKSGSLTNGFAITDGIRPGTITNLAVVATTTTSITLTWTASGDDGYTGTATGYDLKIATFTITEANWDSAARIQGIANPKLSGGTESFIVSNLSSGVTYYFALKAQDDAGLKSVISNVAKAVTLGLIWQKGVSYTSWWYDSYNSQDSDTSIENLGTTGTKWVSLLVTWYQDTNVSTTIYRDTQRTPDDAGLIRAINKIHSLGMKVMLKPHVDIKDDTWRGAIEPSDWNAWFGSYTDFINYYADFAQNNGVEQLCIGCELEKTVSHETEWRKVIEGVRSRFTKPITYAANWDGYDKVNFWDVLDYAGVDAYYPLTDKDNPTIPELMEGCNKWAGSLTLWQQTINKPVIFAEIGYRSIDGVNKHPWEWTGTGTIDLQEQADCYESAFQVFWGKPWFYGMYWWNWDTNPNQGGMTDPNYTPHNKPAEDILCGWYKGIQPQPLNISSNTGINIGTTSVIINGTYFRFGADVRLVKNGSIILGTTTVVIPSGTITTLFDLAGKEPGIWDVVVTNPDGKSGTLTGGFTITKPIIDISGNNQTGTVAATLTSFVVKVTDTYGNPIVGHTVHWQIINSPATASLSAATTTTGTNGTTLSSLTLGTKSGTYKVTATSGSMEEAPLAQATFTATATPGTASILSEVTSNNQTGTVATTLTPFVVKVTDTYGNPIAGHIVHWQIIDTMAGASLSAATTTTGTDGTTLSSLTLGTKSGTYKVTATSDSTEGAPLAQATFTATATPDTASLVEISAVPATILKGGTFTLTIIPKDKNGNVIQSQGTVTLSNLTTSLLPAISNIHAATTLVATITLSPNRGRDVITATVTIGANHVSGTCSILVLLPKEQGDIAVVLPQGTATANGTFTENFWIEIEDKSDAGILTLLSGQIGVAVEITMGTETGGTITGTLPTTIFVEIPFDSTKL